MRRAKMIVFIAAVMSPATATTAGDHGKSWWPQFRGLNASGVAAAQGGLPTHFGPNQNVLWKTPLPSGVSSPCIWGDRIFVTAYDTEKEVLETICLDRTDGQILWRRVAPSEQIEQVHEVSSPANATPATDGQQVYVYFASYGLLCYDFDGNEVWKRALRFSRIYFGNGSSPIVVDDRVILNLDEGGSWRRNAEGKWEQLASKAHILAASSHDGQTVWKTPRQGNGRRYATPALWQHKQGNQVILFGSGRLTGYDLATGKELWWVEGLPPHTCATPVVDGDHVYVTATGIFGEPETYVGIPPYEGFLKEHDQDGDGLVGREEIPRDMLVVDRRASAGAGNSPLSQFARGMDRNRDRKITKEEWDNFRSRMSPHLTADPGLYSIRLDGEGDVTGTHIDWKETRGVTEVPTPLMYDGRLYVVRNGGIVHCRDPKDGRHFFRGRLGAIGGYYASPVAGDRKIYFASDRGVITVLAAGEELKVLAKNDLGDRIMATPALVDGKIYVRTDGHLYAFGTQP